MCKQSGKKSTGISYKGNSLYKDQGARKKKASLESYKNFSMVVKELKYEDEGALKIHMAPAQFSVSVLPLAQ